MKMKRKGPVIHSRQGVGITEPLKEKQFMHFCRIKHTPIFLTIHGQTGTYESY